MNDTFLFPLLFESIFNAIKSRTFIFSNAALKSIRLNKHANTLKSIYPILGLEKMEVIKVRKIAPKNTISLFISLNIFPFKKNHLLSHSYVLNLSD
jgi:hypothetical protein